MIDEIQFVQLASTLIYKSRKEFITDSRFFDLVFFILVLEKENDVFDVMFLKVKICLVVCFKIVYKK